MTDLPKRRGIAEPRKKPKEKAWVPTAGMDLFVPDIVKACNRAWRKLPLERRRRLQHARGWESFEGMQDGAKPSEIARFHCLSSEIEVLIRWRQLAFQVLVESYLHDTPR